MSLAVTNDSKNDSEGIKLFFRTFAKFLVLGIIFHKMLRSPDIRQFRLFLLILAISQDIFYISMSLKNVDKSWHRRHKKFETFNHSIITLQNVMKKFDDMRLMLKNSWGGGENRGGFSPPPASELHFIRTYDLHDCNMKN